MWNKCGKWEYDLLTVSGDDMPSSASRIRFAVWLLNPPVPEAVGSEGWCVTSYAQSNWLLVRTWWRLYILYSRESFLTRDWRWLDLLSLWLVCLLKKQKRNKQVNNNKNKHTEAKYTGIMQVLFMLLNTRRNNCLLWQWNKQYTGCTSYLWQNGGAGSSPLQTCRLGWSPTERCCPTIKWRCLHPDYARLRRFGLYMEKDLNQMKNECSTQKWMANYGKIMHSRSLTHNNALSIISDCMVPPSPYIDCDEDTIAKYSEVHWQWMGIEEHHTRPWFCT